MACREHLSEVFLLSRIYLENWRAAAGIESYPAAQGLSIVRGAQD